MERRGRRACHVTQVFMAREGRLLPRPGPQIDAFRYENWSARTGTENRLLTFFLCGSLISKPPYF